MTIFFKFPFKTAIAHPPCWTIHTFPPQWCTPNNFSLPCRQQLLMYLYFHPNSHLLSSATTSHVYKSVHLPKGYSHLLSSLAFPSLFPLTKHFLIGQAPAGPYRWRDIGKGWEAVPPTCLQTAKSQFEKLKCYNYHTSGSWGLIHVSYQLRCGCI